MMKIEFALVLLICCFASAAAAGVQPEGYIKEWVILGPFANPERPADSKDRGAFDIDYLKPLGGEAKAKIGPDTAIGDIRAKKIAPAEKLDFVTHFAETDHKLAYAYTEIESSEDQEALFFLGSDDGVKLWINGKPAHDNLVARPAVVRQDRFKANLRKGTNSILAKVENGLGDWALILEVYGKEKGRKIEAEIKLEENKREFQRQSLTVTDSTWPQYVFWPGAEPRIIWRDADRVRELVGDIPLTIRWFDSALNEVKALEKPGRHAAYIEGKMKDGTPVRRAMTFYIVPPDLDIWRNWSLDVPYFGKPIDPQAWGDRAQLTGERAADLYRDALFHTEDGAIELAGLCEAKPLGHTATFTESPQVVNDDYQLALKLKLTGLADKVRPLDPPKKLGSPAKVLHEGTPTEAEMKADAKEKIDAVCRQWAEDSGEPFTILVARHGVIVTQEAFGKKPDGAPVGLDYRTDVASITKTVTGMLFSRFLDQGYVKLDDPIGNRVPGFPTKGDDALTYRNLFTHTCSLEGHGEWGGIHNPYLDNVVLNGLEYIHPGRMLVYNGMGYDLAGKAMEYMTGKSIVRLFHQDLLRPMGIDDVRIDDCAFGGHFTARELAILGQWLANHGSYGDKQFVSDVTFKRLLPEPLSKYYPGLEPEWGIGLTWFRETKPGSKDLIFGDHVIGHGSASACILRVDLDHDLVITQIRRTAGEKYGEYSEKFFTAIADSMF